MIDFNRCFESLYFAQPSHEQIRCLYSAGDSGGLRLFRRATVRQKFFLIPFRICV